MLYAPRINSLAVAAAIIALTTMAACETGGSVPFPDSGMSLPDAFAGPAPGPGVIREDDPPFDECGAPPPPFGGVSRCHRAPYCPAGDIVQYDGDDEESFRLSGGVATCAGFHTDVAPGRPGTFEWCDREYYCDPADGLVDTIALIPNRNPTGGGRCLWACRSPRACNLNYPICPGSDLGCHVDADCVGTSACREGYCE